MMESGAWSEYTKSDEEMIKDDNLDYQTVFGADGDEEFDLDDIDGDFEDNDDYWSYDYDE